MNTSEILNKAADLIEERGWRQAAGWPGGGEPEGGSVCLEGGLLAAQGRQYDTGEDYQWLKACPAYRAVRNYLEEQARPTLWVWNDQAGRTKEEVIEVLRATALIEQVREGAPLSVLEPAHVSA